MSLNAHSMQWLNQCGGLLTHVRVDDNGSAVAYKRVPVTHWHNGQKFPHEVIQDLRANSFEQVTIEGLQYYLVPEDTTNAVGHVAYYAENGQENIDVPETTEAPEEQVVGKYLKEDT